MCVCGEREGGEGGGGGRGCCTLLSRVRLHPKTSMKRIIIREMGRGGGGGGVRLLVCVYGEQKGEMVMV